MGPNGTLGGPMAAKKRRRLPRGIEQHGHRFRFRITVGEDRIKQSYATLEEAIAAREKFAKMRQAAPGRAVTLQELTDEVYDSTENLKPATRTYWRSKFDYLLKVFRPELAIHRINADDCRTFLKAELQKKSGTTVAKYYAALSRIFLFAIRRGYLVVNPLQDIKKPRENRRRLDCFRADEFAAIETAIRESGNRKAELHADTVAFFYYTGVRRAEAARLTAEDVDLANGLIYVDGKTEEDAIPIARDLAPILERLLPGMFPSESFIEDVFKRWAQRLDLKGRLRAHAMRHSFASRLLSQGVPIEEVSRLLRHKSIELTRRYYHAFMPNLRRALDVLSPTHRAALGRSRPESET